MPFLTLVCASSPDRARSDELPLPIMAPSGEERLIEALSAVHSFVGPSGEYRATPSWQKAFPLSHCDSSPRAENYRNGKNHEIFKSIPCLFLLQLYPATCVCGAKIAVPERANSAEWSYTAGSCRDRLEQHLKLRQREQEALIVGGMPSSLAAPAPSIPINAHHRENSNFVFCFAKLESLRPFEERRCFLLQRWRWLEMARET